MSLYTASPLYFYGEMWFHNDSSFYTQAMTQSVPAAITCFDNVTNAQVLKGFSYSLSALTCKMPGLYSASWNLSLASSTSNNKHHLWLAINGVEQFDTENHCKPVNSSDVIACSGGSLLRLKLNDVVTIYVNCENSSETMTVYSCNVRLGIIDV
jgi:hypothetical protein